MTVQYVGTEYNGSNRYTALSTDTLPVTGVPNGSRVFLTDTSEYSQFSATEGAWFGETVPSLTAATVTQGPAGAASWKTVEDNSADILTALQAIQAILVDIHDATTHAIRTEAP